MPDWNHYARLILPPPAMLPPERRRALEALGGFLAGLEEHLQRGQARGGMDVQSATLRLLPVLTEGVAPPSRDLERLARGAKFANLTRPQVTALLDGLHIELVQQRFRDRTQLRQYARLRAGVPIEAGLRLLGCPEERARAAASTLGEGVALLGVLLYLREDLARGRMYLPGHVLEAHGMTEADVVAGAWDLEAWRGLLGDWVAQIRGLLAPAGGLTPHLPGEEGGRFVAETLDRLGNWLHEVEKAGAPPSLTPARRRFLSGGMLGRLLGRSSSCRY